VARDLGRVVIIGGGMAGAATAFGLARRGVRDMVLLEQEDIPGYYASGRNAAMVRQLVSQPDIRRLVRHGLAFYEAPPHPFPNRPGFKRTGSLLLATGPEIAKLRLWAQDPGGPPVEFLGAQEVEDWIGVVSPQSCETAAFTPGDGVADIHGLLNGFLAGARSGGARVCLSARVTAILKENGRVTGVKTAAGDHFECRTLVNASGAWAAGIAALTGAARLPLLTFRRHLSQTGPLPGIDPSWPFVWDISHEVYFRPESGGVLLCSCDEGPIEPCDPPVDAAEIETLAEKVALHFPGLKSVELRRTWACIRTFVADRQLCLGPDPELEGFFWAAALGGHGVGLAPALSELIPDLLIDGETRLLSRSGLEAFSPHRFDVGRPHQGNQP
jgi:D-arginine dehydrogenase